MCAKATAIEHNIHSLRSDKSQIGQTNLLELPLLSTQELLMYLMLTELNMLNVICYWLSSKFNVSIVI